MKRLAQLLNLLALLALVALAWPGATPVAGDTEVRARALVESNEPGLGDETPPCVSATETAGSGAARKESGETETDGSCGDDECSALRVPAARLELARATETRVPADAQPHLRVNGSANGCGARC